MTRHAAAAGHGVENDAPPGQAAAIRSLRTLLLVDESSMIPIPDLVALAEARIAKMVLAGDTGQLQAVKNGGASPYSTSPSPRSGL